MATSDGWLPHQIFTRAKMNNHIKTLSSARLQLRSERYPQRTSGINYWNINIQELSNRIFQQLLKPDLPNIKRFYKCNRKQLQISTPFCLNEVLVKKLGYVATSPLALRWMCDSPRMGCARRTTPKYMWREQAILEWSRRVISTVACYHSVKLHAIAARALRSKQLHISEDNHYSCYRILLRPLKTAQYTWIFVGNGSRPYKILWAPPEFSVWSWWLQRHFERPQLFIWIPRWL